VGTFAFASGNRYVGEFRNGLRNGQGTFTFVNGDMFVGEYKNGLRHGQGTLTFANGEVNEGIWKDGKFKYAKKISPTVTAENLQGPYTQ
jgi:hypothetical protein